jgi:hypothetical protein
MNQIARHLWILCRRFDEQAQVIALVPKLGQQFLEESTEQNGGRLRRD